MTKKLVGFDDFDYQTFPPALIAAIRYTSYILYMYPAVYTLFILFRYIWRKTYIRVRRYITGEIDTFELPTYRNTNISQNIFPLVEQEILPITQRTEIPVEDVILSISQQEISSYNDEH
ncbi:hypothetical protein MXB_4243, partial [Myxobolus squamalis]